MALRDFRTPAVPQDFETLYDRPAKPPRDFRVLKDGGSTLVIFEFQDFSGITSRDPTVEYRAYYIPSTITDRPSIGRMTNRVAALNVGRLAATVAATGKGEWLRVSSPDFAGQKGFYMAVGVNRRGVESDPTIGFPSPYGIS